MAATDSMLAVTDPATGIRARRDGALLSEVGDGVALARWSPLPGVRIDTAVAGGAPWHVRGPPHRHRPRARAVGDRVRARLGARRVRCPAPDDPDAGRASATSPWGASTIVDVVEGTVEPRRAAILVAQPERQHDPPAQPRARARPSRCSRARAGWRARWARPTTRPRSAGSAHPTSRPHCSSGSRRSPHDPRRGDDAETNAAPAPALRPGRAILGISAVLLPFTADGARRLVRTSSRCSARRSTPASCPR